MKVRLIFIVVFTLVMHCLLAQQGVAEIIEPGDSLATGTGGTGCKTLAHRFSDVILLRGERLPELLGESISGIRLMARHHG
ncbi:MAG: hypothetical protein GY869_16040, partial [Planctomycetes bacterium]|nr:hypothetical protein [Planctomycetota bacterium]